MGPNLSHWEAKKWNQRKMCDDKKQGQGDNLLVLKLKEPLAKEQ